MAEQLLHASKIRATVEQVRRGRVSEGVRSGWSGTGHVPK